LYLVAYSGGFILATSLEVALGFFEGIHGRPMRASPMAGEYVYHVFPDFPGIGYGPTERAIANLRCQKPEDMPRLPVLPFRVCEEWGADE
jgi:hypothetical protein